MGKVFSVTIRTDCEICHGKLGYRQRRFCSPKCKNRFYNTESITPERRAKRLEAGRAKYNKPSNDKKKCAICGGWYIQLGTHVTQRHGMTAREYKEALDLPLKKGVIPEWYRQKKAQIALENGTASLLPEAGKKTRYIKGDPRNKVVTGWKGRNGSKGYREDDL